MILEFLKNSKLKNKLNNLLRKPLKIVTLLFRNTTEYEIS